MRRISLISLIGVALTYAIVLAGDNIKTAKNPDGTLERVFYSKDKEITKEGCPQEYLPSHNGLKIF